MSCLRVRAGLAQNTPDHVPAKKIDLALRPLSTSLSCLGTSRKNARQYNSDRSSQTSTTCAPNVIIKPVAKFFEPYEQVVETVVALQRIPVVQKPGFFPCA